jgi:hypothetical protein
VDASAKVVSAKRLSKGVIVSISRVNETINSGKF